MCEPAERKASRTLGDPEKSQPQQSDTGVRRGADRSITPGRKIGCVGGCSFDSRPYIRASCEIAVRRQLFSLPMPSLARWRQVIGRDQRSPPRALSQASSRIGLTSPARLRLGSSRGSSVSAVAGDQRAGGRALGRPASIDVSLLEFRPYAARYRTRARMKPTAAARAMVVIGCCSTWRVRALAPSS